MVPRNRPVSSLPWYSSGTGGMRIHTSSVISATSASTSLASNARTNRPRSSCSSGEFGAGGGSPAFERAGHRLLGAFQDVGDLPGREIEHIAQDQGGSLPRRQ